MWLLKSNKQKLERFDLFYTNILFKGKVNIKSADRTFIVIEDNYNKRIYFGKVIAGRIEGKNHYIYNDRFSKLLLQI